MKRRGFIGWLVLAPLMAEAWLMEMAAVFVLILGLLAILALRKLSHKNLGKKAPPPPDQDSSYSPPTGPMTTLPALVPSPDSVWAIDPDYLDADGQPYTHFIDTQITTSTDLRNWTACGSLNIWCNDVNGAVRQMDATGAMVKDTLTKMNANLPLAGISLPPAIQRFFKLT